MTPVIKYLDATKNWDVLEHAWHWSDSAPEWFRESINIWKESLEEYRRSAPNELLYGVFVDEQPTAVIRLCETHPFVFNIHLNAKRKTDFGVLLQAGSSVRDYLFDHGVNVFYGYIWKGNRGIIKLYEGLGFHDSGIRVYKGKVRGRIAEMVHMVCPKNNFTNALELK